MGTHEHSRASANGWLAAAEARAALPHSQGHTGFARAMTHRLMSGHRTGVATVLCGTSSGARVRAWKELLQRLGDPELNEFFAYRPQDVISVLGPQLPEERRWSTLVEIYEACYSLARAAGSDGAGHGLPYTERIVASQLARTRWVLLSIPFRGPSRPGAHDLRRVDDDTGRLVALTQQARDDWLAVLATIDDYPQLAGRIGDVEVDAEELAATLVTRTRLGLEPSSKIPSDEDRADRPGREASRFAVTRLLLPRFAWRAATTAYLRSAGQLPKSLSAAALVIATAAVALYVLGSTLPWNWAYTGAAIAASATYLLVVAATSVHSGAAWPWLLRQPAGAGVGLLALASFGQNWWYTGGANNKLAPATYAAAGLTLVAFAYIYIEAAGHGLRGSKLARRPLWVGVLGFTQSLLVSLIGLRFILPAFAAAPDHGPSLSCWYTSGSCQGKALPAPLLVILAASWSFAAGVLLQIVWDDQPVTAPLSHVSWHRGG